MDLEQGVTTTAEDIVALRELRNARVAGLLACMNELSAERIRISFPQRRSTSAGLEPFTL